MAQDQVEASGKTVEDALNIALARLGARREDVEFVVLDEGKRGGLFGRGGRDAVVRVERIEGGSRDDAPIDRSTIDTSIPRRRTGREGRDTRATEPPGMRRAPGRGRGRPAREYDAPSPRLTEEAFRRPGSESGPADAGRDRRPRGARDGRPQQERGAPAERGALPEAARQERPRPERHERRREEEQPYVEPNIDAPEVDFACQTIDDLLRILQIPGEITIRAPESPGDGLGMVRAVVDIHGDDLGLLIGRRGDTLHALQYIVNLIVSRRFEGVHTAVAIDVAQYRKRRELQLLDMAERMGERVRRTGTPITLEPMTPAERRIIHLALADDPELVTNSIGEGDSRKVVISTRE